MRSAALFVVVAGVLAGCGEGAHLRLTFEGLDASADHVTVSLRSPQIAFAGQPRSQGSVSVGYPGDGTLTIDAGRDAFADGTLSLALSAPTALDLTAHASASRGGAPDGVADAATRVTPGADVALTFDFASTDGGVPDLAVMPDAAPPDLEPPPSLCATAGVLFCDGFELDVVDKQKWSEDLLNGGAVLVDFNRAYRGKHSLHVLLPSLNPLAQGRAQLDETTTFVDGGTGYAPSFFVRAFVWLATTVNGEQELVTVAQAPPDTQEIAFETQSTNMAVFDDVGQKTLINSGMAMPLNQWVCVEMEINNGGVVVFIDGQKVQTLQVAQSTVTTPPLGMISIGLAQLRRSQTMPAPQEAWFDEVAIDSNPIGCDR